MFKGLKKHFTQPFINWLKEIWEFPKIIFIFTIPVIIGVVTIFCLTLFFTFKQSVAIWIFLGFFTYIYWPIKYFQVMRKQDWLTILCNIWMVIFGPFNIILARPI
jgi:hypothetical protein